MHMNNENMIKIDKWIYMVLYEVNRTLFDTEMIDDFEKSNKIHHVRIHINMKDFEQGSLIEYVIVLTHFEPFSFTTKLIFSCIGATRRAIKILATRKSFE